ncbi:zinc ABC transporter substrate-binding protein ZnuA [Photobacterium halotolerans]|uniref:High-affinity zinc uptake system protein ZnuA n=1 Tax=Photobacterium halotolerans TaxID=265726 RepID=A0A0F5V8Y8_9GAMM|nr:zinc ABC transporter substrate-binding protein ZnuA [Photobacterium halotolerans]KKC97994.1 zinc ABC transporter substrate-binding protein [Photobacterium halotolerans]
MLRFKAWYLVAMVLVPLTVSAKDLHVVATVHPVNLIVQELVEGAGQSETLLPAGSSPHDYALRPSDVEKLKAADLVVWVGPELESFLTKILTGQENALSLTSQETISFRDYEGHEDHDDHESHESHESHDSHEGHEHHHDGIDPHLWLGPDQAIQAAKVISAALIELDPLNRAQYEANLSRFTASVHETVQNLKEQLQPVRHNGYYVFHDAYGYFEETFGLNNLGHFTVSPDRRPGAKTLIAIRNTLKKSQVQCIFREPQFSPAVINSVTNGSDIKIGTLDPMATDIASGQGGYVRFLQELGRSFAECLK